MAKPTAEDPRLVALSKICLALPEAIRQLLGDHASFQVRKKKFAYYLSNHHGDGIVAVTCKVLPGENRALASAQPERFYLPAYLASRGWVALRLDRGSIDWREVKDLIDCSYQLIAPKRSATAANQGPRRTSARTPISKDTATVASKKKPVQDNLR